MIASESIWTWFLWALKSLMFVLFVQNGLFYSIMQEREDAGWNRTTIQGWAYQSHFLGWRGHLLETTFTLSFTGQAFHAIWGKHFDLFVVVSYQHLGLATGHTWSLSVSGTETNRCQLQGLETSNWAYCCNHCHLLGLRLIVVSCRGLRPGTRPTVVIIVSCWDWD